MWDTNDESSIAKKKVEIVLDGVKIWVDFEQYQFQKLNMEYMEEFMCATHRLNNPREGDSDYPAFQEWCKKVNEEILSQEKYKPIREFRNDTK